MMKSKITKGLMGTLFGLAVVLPAMANSTQITLSGTVVDFTVLRLENPANVIVSTDLGIASPVSETINFGTVTAGGAPASGASSSSTNVSVGTVIARTIGGATAVTDLSLYDPAATTQPAFKGGAIYFLDSQVQLRALKGVPADTVVTTAVSSGATTLPVVLGLSSATNWAAGQTMPAGMHLATGTTGNALGTFVHDSPQLLDVGIHVPFSTTAGTYSTTVTFTGV